MAADWKQQEGGAGVAHLIAPFDRSRKSCEDALSLWALFQIEDDNLTVIAIAGLAAAHQPEWA
jgi:hypothetical protein